MSDELGSPTDDLFVSAYNELRRLAYGLRRDRNQTLNPTALVHEAYIKLLGSKRFHAESPEHLKYTLVRAMKFVLVDAARQKSAAMRGGGEVPLRRVPLEDATTVAVSIDPDDVIAVSEALDALGRRLEPQARAFELQFFGGLQIGEIAELMGVSEKKVQRLLRLARASLSAMLTCGEGPRRTGDESGTRPADRRPLRKAD
jgi:RNA polymerase sigma factor (TIGR02999 family)